MDNTNFWFSSGATGGGGGGDQGQPIGQSLRFRDSQFLHNTALRFNNGTAGTFSCWFKFANLGAFNYILGGGTSTDNGYLLIRGDGNNLGLFQTRATSGGTFTDYSADRFRDPSAWYHLCLQNTVGGQLTLFVNGEQIGQLTPTFGTASAITIGNNLTTGNDDNLNGYLADVYFIDGQVLEPTAFGRFNDDDVWVPREVDFTPTTMRWSDFLTVSNGTIDNGPLGTTAAFNGDLSDGDGRCFTSPGGDLTWAPPADNPATFTTTLEIFNTNAASQQNISWNGNTVNPTGGWVTIFTDPSPDPDNPNVIDVDQPLVIDSIGAQRAELYAVRLDGEIVLNPFMWSADYTTNTSFSAADPAQKTFDGNTGTVSDAIGTAGANTVCTFAPSNTIENITSLRVFCTLTTSVATFNGATTNLTTNGWNTINLNGGTELSTTSTLTLTRNQNSASTQIAAIEVNGQILIDGVNNSYGPNGFHLTFAQDTWSTTGTVDTTLVTTVADLSGNGNDFTANGFVIWPSNAPGTFSNGLTVPGGWQGVAPATAAFNGLDRPGAASNTSGATATWAPNPAVQFEESFEVLASTQTWQYNGDNGEMFGFDWYPIATGAGEISANTPFVFTGNTTFANMNGVRIDGVVLVEGGGADYDIMQDSPTQNYATLNPLNTVSGTDNGITAANLQNQDTNGTQASTWTGTISMSGGLQYFEVTRIEADSSLTYGVVPDDLLITDGNVGLAEGVWINKSGNLSVVNVLTVSYLPDINQGDTVCVAFNSGTGQIWFGRNGTFVGDPVAGTNPAGTLNMTTGWVPYVRCVGASGLDRAAINCGQQPFLYTPPAGFEALQTQNLPTPTILDGRDNFLAITLEAQDPAESDEITSVTQIQGRNYTASQSTGSDEFTTAQQINDGLNSGCVFLSPTTGTYRLEFDPPVAIDSISDNGDVAAPNGSLQINGTNLTPTFGCSVNQTNINLSSFQVQHQQGSWVVLVGINTTNTALAFDEVIDVVLEPGSDMTVYNVGDVVSTTETGGEDRGVIQAVTAGTRTLRIAVTRGNFIVGEHIFLVETEILGAAQAAFPNGLWWIKDMVNANQNQFVDSVRGGNLASQSPSSLKNQAYVAPTGESVAWCWNSAQPAVSGFNIIEYTGNANATQAVAHGLPGTPEFIISMSQSLNTGMETFHVSCATGQSVTIDSNRAQAASTRYQGVDGTNITYGGDYNTNGELMIAYAWTSIPGYSAFGSYAGSGPNGGNGTYIHCNFRPAFVVVKAINSAQSWALFDSTRYPQNTNGATPGLTPNSTLRRIR